jgi:acyl-CoA synthetase (AMP-forming)/AMP-acid ligase II
VPVDLAPPPAAATSGCIALELDARAAEAPDRIAVHALKTGERATFAELRDRSHALAHGLAELGIQKGDRACLFVRPGVDLIAATFALFRVGAVPVLIDPGMGRKNLLSCVERMRPRAFVGIPLAQLARRLFPEAFRSVELGVTVGRRLPFRDPTLASVERAGAAHGDYPPERVEARDPAAVLFTSGSTGPPKGVSYTHGMFAAQVRALRELYGLEPGETDVACFPLFALLDAALGITSVFPDLDPSRPGRCDPARIVRALEESRATLTFGSPAIWRRVLPWCSANGVELPHLRRALIAGAPVPPALVEAFRSVLGEDGDVYTPYGATESLPVASISGAEILELRARAEAGEGTCVGRPAPGVDVRLIEITDEALARWSDARPVRPGEPGEICVRGAAVTRAYQFADEATARAKIAHEGAPGDPRVNGGIWHRMGDAGRVDPDGRLWFLGRVAHRVETPSGTLFPVPAEQRYLTHPAVGRAAVVGVGEAGTAEPVLVVEPADGRVPRGAAARTLGEELLAHGRGDVATRGIERVLFHPSFPVDVRHNAKIHRLELGRWAAEKLS